MMPPLRACARAGRPHERADREHEESEDLDGEGLGEVRRVERLLVPESGYRALDYAIVISMNKRGVQPRFRLNRPCAPCVERSEGCAPLPFPTRRPRGS